MTALLILFGATCGVLIGWYLGRRYEQSEAYLTIADRYRRVWRAEIDG